MQVFPCLFIRVVSYGYSYTNKTSRLNLNHISPQKLQSLHKNADVMFVQLLVMKVTILQPTDSTAIEELSLQGRAMA
jgi:hypothetical protein